MPLFTKQQTLCFYFACPVHCKLPQFSLEIGGNIVTEKQILMLSIGTLFFNIIQPNGDFNYKQYITEENYLQFSCLINAYMDHQVQHPLLGIRSHTINECVFLLISPKSVSSLPLKLFQQETTKDAYKEANSQSEITVFFNMCFNII